MKKSFLLSLCLLGVVSAAHAGYKTLHKPAPEDPMQVSIFQLDNGLTVYLSENHETPRFYSEMAVRAGSKMDPAATTGLAHYLEHLMFKGTRKLGTTNWKEERALINEIIDLYEQHFNEKDPDKRKAIYKKINEVSLKAGEYAIANEVDKLYNTMGASTVNAHCWHEETVYKVGLPANRFEQWAMIESERFTKPVFRLFHTELETVYEEKNRSIDNKDRAVSYAMYEHLWKVHPYGQQPTLGSVDHLKNPSIKNIHHFYDTYYVPNNMALCISGDIQTDEAIATIDKAFSKLKSKKLPEPKTWEETPMTEVDRVTVKFQGEPYVLLGFRTVGNGHPDQEALAMLDMIMDNSAAGMINLNLNQQQKVRSAGSYPSFYNDSGVEQFFAVPKQDQTHEEAELLLLEQIKLVADGKFEDWLIPAILTDFKKNEKTALESDTARAAMLRDAFLSHEDWSRTYNKIARMEKVTKADVQRVAKKYFSQGYVAVYRIDEQHEVPGVPKPEIDPVTIDPTRQSRFAKKVLAMDVKPMTPEYIQKGKDYQRVDLPSGITLYHVTNPLNDLFTLSIEVEAGSEQNKNLPMAAALLDKTGTGDLSASDLKKEWYKLGSSFGFGAAVTESTFGMSGLDEKFDASLDLMMRIINQPKAEEADFTELKSIMIARRADAKKDPQTVNRALTLFNRHGKDSTFLTRLTDAELLALEKATLFKDIADLLNYELTISYTGKLSIEALQEKLGKHLDLKTKRGPAPAHKPLFARKIEQTQIYFYHKEMAQAQVRIEFPDGKVDEALRVSTELYNSYFDGGMSGVVFQELREARGLAYSAGARYVTAPRVGEENIMIGVIGTQADKAADALDAFMDLFDKLPESDERFAESKNGVENQYKTAKIGFRGVVSAVQSWEKLGLEGDPRKARFEEIEASDMKTMMTFVDGHIRNKPKLISIVGDKSKIDLEGLKKHGTIIEVSEEQIFN
ncbi:MAG: putative Zn-dependent peptidase [Kiritimatiellia bacterium]|jgi:predicted Zn-dependent peptidase